MPESRDLLSSFLYCSVLCADSPSSCIGDIVRQARQTNARLDLTGLLIFDGQRLCQYLEGPSAALQEVLQRIQVDTRHEDLRLQHHAPLHSPRRFKQWAIAYAEVDQQALQTLAQLQGPAALQALQQLLPTLDQG